jgi:hypothetical protein
MNEQVKRVAEYYMVTDLTKVEKLLSARSPMNLVFEWVKTNHMNLSSFRQFAKLATDLESSKSKGNWQFAFANSVDEGD